MSPQDCQTSEIDNANISTSPIIVDGTSKPQYLNADTRSHKPRIIEHGAKYADMSKTQSPIVVDGTRKPLVNNTEPFLQGQSIEVEHEALSAWCSQINFEEVQRSAASVHINKHPRSARHREEVQKRKEAKEQQKAAEKQQKAELQEKCLQMRQLAKEQRKSAEERRIAERAAQEWEETKQKEKRTAEFPAMLQRLEGFTNHTLSLERIDAWVDTQSIIYADWAATGFEEPSAWIADESHAGESHSAGEAF